MYHPANPTRSRRWRAGTRKNKQHKTIGSFGSDHTIRPIRLLAD